jgi:membrane-bound serine protease (ClpP class)
VRRSGFIKDGPAFEGGTGPPGPQGKLGVDDRIFTAVKGPFLRVLLVSLAVALAVPAFAFGASSSKPRVLAIHFEFEVNPVTSSYLDHQLDRAQKNGYAAAVIVLDTPGGLSESMRTIVKNELRSKIPVIVYVSPPGSRAASAGVWIGEAADELAMAPATNIGSSTPINGNGTNLGSDLRRKVLNDAAASLRGLAKFHGRNVKWADLAVRKASNLTAEQALQMNVIDDIAPNLPALLRRIDGRKTVGKDFVLHTAGAQIVDVHPGFFTRLLNTLIDPNLIPLLFLAGLAGIGFEIFHPGVVLPGALGAVSLLTALFGFAVLPISWAGLALLILGAALLVIDAHVVSHGALTVSGLISLVVGSLLLFHNAPAPYNHVNAPLLIIFAALLGSIWVFALTKAVQVRRSPVAAGPETMVGEVGEARRDDLVFVHGELWRARPRDGETLRPGQRIRVSGIGPELVLEVEPLPAE